MMNERQQEAREDGKDTQEKQDGQAWQGEWTGWSKT